MTNFIALQNTLEIYLLVFKMRICPDFSLTQQGQDITASLCCFEMTEGGFVTDCTQLCFCVVSAAALSQTRSKPLQNHGVYKSPESQFSQPDSSSILCRSPRNEIFSNGIDLMLTLSGLLWPLLHNWNILFWTLGL